MRNKMAEKKDNEQQPKRILLSNLFTWMRKVYLDTDGL